MLWKELSKQSSETILVHHCSLINSEGRYAVELNASRNIIKWIKENVSNNFIYIETVFDYRQVMYVIRDIEVIAFMNAAILRSRRYNIKEILVSANSHDESNDPNEISVVRRRKILDIIGITGQDSEKLRFPMIHMTKAEIIEEMPDELFLLTWYCRRPSAFNLAGDQVSPLSEDASEWKACGSCKTCTQVQDALGQ